MKRARSCLFLGALCFVLCTGGAGTCVYYGTPKSLVARMQGPAEKPEPILVDDRPADKKTTFDPMLVDRRLVGQWLVNLSEAPIELDINLVFKEDENHLLTLYPSYAEAVAAARKNLPAGVTLLPSLNLIDGKAKQFDDGLYAALDQAYYRGLGERLQSHVQLVRRIYEKVGKDSVAAPFLAAGLEIAGVKVDVADQQAKDSYVRGFRAVEVRSKPIGFYTWNPTLADCFRFLRFFQIEFGPDKLREPLAIARALAEDPSLRADYQKVLDFYARLTNPYICLSAADLVGLEPPGPEDFKALCKARGVTRESVALFPPSTSREGVLFERLFPLALPENVDLMRELIRAVRSGKVDLKPGPNSGWYDYQAYALETLLLPGKGEESSKLVLTRAYKERLVEAFKALITKRRETHVRQVSFGCGMKSAVQELELPAEIHPRLRVEPCPTYFVRTARAYAFLFNFLEATLGKDALSSLHGLTQAGERTPDLRAELIFMRDLFYGLYLVSAEDIGMKPSLLPDEPVDQDRCYKLAEEWLGRAFDDPDLVVDTRISVPIYVDPLRNRTRLWMTLGVRMAKLEVEFADHARPPRIRPVQGDGDWQIVERKRLGKSRYLIAGDEFAEVELMGLTSLTREELRAVCDKHKTKEEIVKALTNR